MLARTTSPRRRGKVLVLFVILLTSLLGVLGLVLDGGLMMASFRRTQNVADGAALAAAMNLMRGGDATTARAAATTFVATHNGLSDATITVNIPPATGPHAGNGQYAEVILSRPYDTVFIQAVGAGADARVSTRAVAGYEPVSSGEGAIVLDPTAAPGLSFSGTNTRLRVKGTVVVNSQTNGWDQYGQAVPTGSSPRNPYAISTSTSVVSDPAQAFILARAVHVVGGVDTPANIRDYDDPVNNPTPLYARSTVGPDPLRLLPVPSPATVTSISNWTRQAAINVITGDTRVFTPGVYEDINITGGTATFNPGVYILSPTKNNQGLRISGGTTTGDGVMFYVAGSDYLDGAAGANDITDGAYDGPLPPTNGTFPPDPFTGNGSVDYATLSLAGSSGSVTFTGLAYNSENADDRILFFQRRRNTSAVQFGGSGSDNMVVDINGTIYAKWARVSLAGGRTYDSQFIVGSLELKGGSTMTINGTGVNRGRANLVFLVE